MVKDHSIWISKAQRWLANDAASVWAAWLETKNGVRWKAARYRKTRKGNSPYAWGFSLPDYHRNLIKAIGEADEETAKAIMMYSRSSCSNGIKLQRRTR